MQPYVSGRRLGVLVAVLLAPGALAAQEPAPPKKWSVEEIHGTPRKIAFTVDEGTWMSVDVSPDGKTRIFDLLGDLYTLPIGRGKATRFTSGTRWDATPRYSPDGKRVLFSSDPTGSDQLWTIPAEGGAPTQVTEEGPYQYLQPAWDPSGDFVFGLRQTRPFVPTEFVMVHLGGGPGTGFPIPASPAWLPRRTGAGFTTRPISPGPMPAAPSSASTGAPGTGRPSSPAMNRSAGRLSARTAGGSPLR